MRNRICLLLFVCPMFLFAFGQEKEVKFAFDNYHRYYQEAAACTDSMERAAMKELRARLHAHPYRFEKVAMPLSARQCLEFLTDKGTFSDMDATEAEFERLGIYKKGFHTTVNDKVGIFIGDALNRICCIADAYRKKELAAEEALSPEVLKAVTHYGMLEVRRSNSSPRFHASCFAIPTAAENIYFAWLDKMDEAEAGSKDTLLVAACDMLKVLGLQAYTQPLRNDETDKNVVSIERFRNHVWWVGGNALAYRPLLPVAAMYSSVPMIETLAEVCRRGINVTSQHTVGSSFWTEGFTADGAGWGHGKQCLVWGYPIDGTFNALKILSMLKGTPWEKKLERENTEAVMNFFRGGNWYYYKGFTLPCLDRGSYAYRVAEKKIPYANMLNVILRDWSDCFTDEERAELKRLQKEVKENRINMGGYPSGMYSGTRWFFNNDDLIKKTPDFHLIVNMASVRCDGLESAPDFADEYNFYPTDGMTLFQREGNEYRPIMGGWDVTASPGVTAREGMERLKPVVNWRGYCSKHNFAGAATDGSGDAAAGYIFEKMNASEKEGVNDRGSSIGQNEVLYGVKACKSWFIQGDYVVALGAGVTNKQPEQPGNVRTTLDQTAWVNDVYFCGNGQRKALSEGLHRWNAGKKGCSWIVQEGKFAYRVLPEYSRDAFVACETRPADWTGRNKSNGKLDNLPDSVRILRLWIDHGQKPLDDTYGYAVYTGKGEPSDELPFRVLRNDTLVQAVQSSDKRLIQAVFYPGGKGLRLEFKGVSLEVSAPCALMIKTENGKSRVSVTDACMNAGLKEITVTYNGSKTIVPLPQGAFCGKPATVETGR